MSTCYCPRHENQIPHDSKYSMHTALTCFASCFRSPTMDSPKKTRRKQCHCWYPSSGNSNEKSRQRPGPSLFSAPDPCPRCRLVACTYVQAVLERQSEKRKENASAIYGSG
ncbi:hypothetical protein GQ55_1G075900 [Panicum hallii var. hallii]|uniref:Uncharacterized protein n=1 Tax=Panicum hallii var. hallii TaxID=1504633 RepID=A0A2T7F3C5_9POAL|nr:hypothetical protein GQ55_1G075900 [Panicum hallii var. hallii]